MHRMNIDHGGKSRMRYTRIFSTIGLLGFLLNFLVCGGEGKDAGSKEEAAVPVKIMRLAPDRIQETLSYTGSVEAWKELNVVPDIGGKISRIYVEIGDAVKKDNVLAELDKETFELQLHQAEAGLAVAQSSLDDAEKNYQRALDLQSKGSISQQQFEKIQLAHNAAKAQYRQAEAALELTRWQLDVSVMKAPFDGVITGKWLNEGDIINPQMPGARGVVSIMDLSRLKIGVHASEQEVTKIKKGLPAQVMVDVYPDRTFQGSVYAVNAAANPTTRTFEIQIAVPNSGNVLKAGMFARVDVVTQEKSNALVVPTDALLGREQDRYLYVIEGETAVKRPVTLGIVQNNRAEVTAGIQFGEHVVIVGQQMLHDGSRVVLGGGDIG